MTIVTSYARPDVIPMALFYELIAECPAFQSRDECINENNSLLIGITWDADRDAPPFKAGRVHYSKPRVGQSPSLSKSPLAPCTSHKAHPQHPRKCLFGRLDYHPYRLFDSKYSHDPECSILGQQPLVEMLQRFD